MAYAKSGVSTNALTKEGGFIHYHTADALATVEGSGYFNSLAVDSAIPAVGIIIHYDTNLKKVTLYGYSHDGATVTLSTANKEVLV